MSSKKKNKMERGLTNRHVQVCIAGTIGTGLFLGAGRFISLPGPFHCADLYDYWGFHVPHDACGWEMLYQDPEQHTFINFYHAPFG